MDGLRGKRLGCWCAPSSCHACYLVEVAALDGAIARITHLEQVLRDQEEVCHCGALVSEHTERSGHGPVVMRRPSAAAKRSART